MKSLRFVHLSDIHFGQEDKNGNKHVHADVRLELERDCRRLKDRGGAHGLIVTGDIAYSGKWEEYERAAEWLESLCKIVGCEKDAVLVVPGNHDVDLAKLTGAPRLIQDRLKNCKEHELEDLLKEIHQSPEAAHPFAPKMAAYLRLAKMYYCDFKITESHWTKYFDLDHGCRLKFIGLNTVQVTDLRDRPGDLILGEVQYVQPREDNVEFVVLMHHPVNWLKDKPKFEDYFNSRVRILMCGHEHKAKITTMKHGQKFEQLLIDGGATNPPKLEEGYGYTYNWLEFELTKNDQSKCQLMVRIFPRIWNKRDTRFEADPSRLKLTCCDNEAAEILIDCPDLIPTSNPESVPDADVGPSKEDTQSEVQVLEAEGEDRRFKRLQYYFWRYPKGVDRLAMFVDLSLVQSASGFDDIPQDIEMQLLHRAKEEKKLKALWDKVMEIVPTEQRQENPFEEGE